MIVTYVGGYPGRLPFPNVEVNVARKKDRIVIQNTLWPRYDFISIPRSAFGQPQFTPNITKSEARLAATITGSMIGGFTGALIGATLGGVGKHDSVFSLFVTEEHRQYTLVFKGSEQAFMDLCRMIYD